MNYLLNNKNFVLITFLIVIFLIILRAPCYFIQEGWWNIKGNSFYINSSQSSFFESLIFVLPSAGYFEFFTNIVSKIASYFPNYAKLIDVIFIFFLKIIIFAYVILSKSNLILNNNYKLIFISLILFSPPMTPEIWMTSLHARSYFAILTILMIFQNFNFLSYFQLSVYRIALIFSGLSSIYSSVLSPIFLLNYFFYKTKIHFINFLLSLIPLIINISLFFKFYLISDDNDGSRIAFNFSKIISFTYNILVRPFTGGTIPEIIYNKFFIKFSSDLLISLIIIFAFLVILFLKNNLKKDKIFLLLLSIFIIQCVLSLFGSLYGNFVGGRYAVIPGLVLLFLLLRTYQLEKKNILKKFYLFLIVFSLIVGFVEFKYFSPLPNMLECGTKPLI